MKLFYICLISWIFVVNAEAMNHPSCFSFGDTAHNHPYNLYIATINVGTGECHVIRHGDESIIVDAGVRHGPVSANEVTDFLEDFLGHNLRQDPDNTQRNIFDRSSLKAIFVTHPHDDHTNIIENILNDNSILKDNAFCAFLGGLGDEYDQTLVDIITELNPTGNALMQNGVYNIAGVNVSAFDVDSSFDSPSDGQDINRFGAVIGIQFSGRNNSFLGDIDFAGFKGIANLNYGNFSLGQPGPNHNIWNIVRNADVITAPHHGLLNNMEGYIYKTLLHQKQSRLFLASADPTGTLPILSDILIDVDQANKLTWTHNLSLHNIFIDHTIQDYNHSTVTNLTNVPLFSTYDAPNGFIWTRIDSTGNISVYDGTSFQRVL